MTPPAKTPLPTTGGEYMRQDDGSLVPTPVELERRAQHEMNVAAAAAKSAQVLADIQADVGLDHTGVVDDATP